MMWSCWCGLMTSPLRTVLGLILLDRLRQPGDAPGPFSFNISSSFEFQSQFCEKGNGVIKGFHDDADIIHSYYFAHFRRVLVIRISLARGTDDQSFQALEIYSIN